MYRTAPIEIDPDELFKSLERRFQRTITTQDNTIDLNVSSLMKKCPKIHFSKNLVICRPDNDEG